MRLSMHRGLRIREQRRTFGLETGGKKRGEKKGAVLANSSPIRFSEALRDSVDIFPGSLTN